MFILIMLLSTNTTLKSMFWKVYYTIYEEEDPLIEFYCTSDRQDNEDKTGAKGVTKVGEIKVAEQAGFETASKETKAIADLNRAPDTCHWIMIHKMESLMSYGSFVHLANIMNRVSYQSPFYLYFFRSVEFI